MDKKNKNTITVFEHQVLRADDSGISKKALAALQNFYGEKGVPYYSLIHKGVKFCEYVGVLQVGKYTIEILPKADKNENKEEWKRMLIDMLRAVGIFDIQAPSTSALSLKANSILDLYFKLFLDETEQLLHKGLVKRYHKTEGNRTALKGNILFGKHIQQNLVHQERFYVRYTTYDNEHSLNCVLYKTIQLLQRINTNSAINSKIGALLLNFPEMPSIKIDEAFFEKLIYNRKTEHYKKAIEIAKLLLLSYHPDISKGKNDVLALMFDMNLLWEQFVYRSLKKYNSKKYQISPQSYKYFWRKSGGNRMKMIPDIVIHKENNEKVVLDTKWKNIGDYNPSPEDLRQMYTYGKYHNNAQTALIYPGDKCDFIKGSFFKEEDNNIDSTQTCGILKIKVEHPIKTWQASIAEQIFSKI